MNFTSASPFVPFRRNLRGGPLTRIETETQNQFLSGYGDEFLSVIDEDLICSICQQPLRMPVLTRCGHRFCKGCLDEVCKRQPGGVNQPFTCPMCRTSQSRQKDVFPDNATQRKILSLVIKCPNKNCKWTGDLKNKEIHLSSCPERVVKCTNNKCTEMIPLKDMEKHLSTCQWKMIRCDYCDQQHPACQLSQHHHTCKRFPVNCSKGCGETFPREETQKHLRSCPEEIVECTSKNCTETMARKYLEEHVTTRCQWRMMSCEHCNIRRPACKQSEHRRECKRFPVNCPDNCGQIIPREELKAHTDAACPMATVPCPYAEMGCQRKIRRRDIDSHIQSASSGHLGLACSKIIELFKEQKALKQTTESLDQRLKDCLKENEMLKKSKVTLETTTRNTFQEQEQLKRTMRNLQDKLEQEISAIKTQLNTKVARSENVYMIERTREIDRRINLSFPNGQEQTSRDDLNRTKDDLRREITSLKNKFDEQIKRIETNMSIERNNLHKKIKDAVPARQVNQADLDDLYNDILDNVNRKLDRFRIELNDLYSRMNGPPMAPQMAVVPYMQPYACFGAWGYRPF